MDINEKGADSFGEPSIPNNSEQNKDTNIEQNINNSTESHNQFNDDQKRKVEFRDTKLLKVKTANAYMKEAKNKAIPKKLFGTMWLEGQLVFMIASTGVGKSILGVQCAIQITSGDSSDEMKSEVGKQKVLYFDFELTDKQFQMRYSEDNENLYNFDDNFFRVEIQQSISEIPDGYEDFEDYLLDEIEKCIRFYKASIIIIDNISYIKTDTEKSKHAHSLMLRLNDLKKRLNLSILVMAHTPKRDQTKPITENDLAGSAALGNFIDGCFALVQSSKDPNIRYLKHLKARDTEKEYIYNNVLLLELVKSDSYLHFEVVGTDKESEHLKSKSSNGVSRKDLDDEIVEMHRLFPENTNADIAKALLPDGYNPKSFEVRVGRVIKRFKDNCNK